MRTSFPVDAPPEAWAALADPARLAAALPGCRSVTHGGGGGGGGPGDRAAGGGSHDGGDTLQVVTEVAVASVRGLWAGTVTRLDTDAVHVRGAGVPGAVDLVLRADPDRTTVTVEGTVEGPLATVGSSVLAAALRRTADDLLSALAGQDARSPAAPGVSPAAATDPARAVDRDAAGASATAAAGLSPAVPPVSEPHRTLRRAVAVGAAVVVVGAALLGRRLARQRARSRPATSSAFVPHHIPWTGLVASQPVPSKERGGGAR